MIVATPAPYRFVRHPLYLGFLLAFWAAPTMTVAHLVFAVATTAYIVVAIQFEERDLAHELGGPYQEYRRRVPMLFPRLPRRLAATTAAEQAAARRGRSITMRHESALTIVGLVSWAIPDQMRLSGRLILTTRR